jgi:hypothetical protein
MKGVHQDMKPLLRLVLLLVAVAFVAQAGLAKTTPPPPDYFPLKVGYWWKYTTKSSASDKSSEFTLKVIKTDKAADGALTYVMETAAGMMLIHDWYAKPAGWVLNYRELYVKNNMTADFTPVKKYLANPLSNGAAWEWSGKGMMGVEASEKNVVKGSETVVVPAGKFACMRVDSDIVQGGQQVHKTYWYANHVGLVKSQTESGGVKSETQLVDYSFKR